MLRHDQRQPIGWVVCAAACFAGFAVASVRAIAQPEEPLVIGERAKLSGLHLDYVNMAMEVFAQRVGDQTKPAVGASVTDREDLVRETLVLSTAGWVGHRNLFQFDATGRLRISEEFLSSESAGQNRNSLELLSEFDTRGVFLGKSRFPFTIFGRRDQLLLTRSFGGTLDSTITEMGARLDYRSAIAPMNIEYRRRIQAQEDTFGNTGFDAQQHTIAYRGQYHPNANHQLVWTYTLDFVTETGTLRPVNSFRRQDAVLTHDYSFGEDNRDSIRSDLRFFENTGDFQVRRLRLNEILRFKHGPNLDTRYEYLFDQQVRPEFTQTMHRGLARVEHRLFESLVTIAQAGGEYITSTDGDFTSKAGFGLLDTRYSKRVPCGKIYATFTSNADWRNESDRGGSVPVSDVLLNFDSAGLSKIIRRNIDSASVVVTDPTGLITFVENLDYRVRQLGDRTEIRLVPGGDILSGDTVLADYIFTPDPANTTVTTSFSGSLRYTLEQTPMRGLSPFVRYFNQRQSRNSEGSFILPVSDISDLVFGLEYDTRSLSLRAQREIRNSSLSPFVETLFEGQYTARAGASGAFSLNLRYDDIDRTDENFCTKVSSLTARWNGRILQELSGDMLFILRREQDSAGPDSFAFEQRLNLTWRRGQTEIFASVRNSFVDSSATDTHSKVFLIGYRRSF